MTRFSPSEAAFEGFRVIRSHPGAVLAWAVAYVLLYVGFAAVAVALFGPQIAEVSSYSGQTTMPPDVAMRWIGSMGLFALLALPVGLVLAGVFITAVYRPILRPADKGLFYLKLGGDELRIALLIFIYILLLIATEIVVVLSVVLAALGIGHITLPVSAGWLRFGAFLAIFCLAIWVAIRLSLAAPVTFARKKLDVFGSWRVTRGRFWSLLGCYILAWIFAVLITVLGWIVSVSAGAVVTGDWTAMSNVMVNPRMAMMASGIGLWRHMFTTAAMVQIGLSSLIGAVGRVVMYAPMAAAYRDLAGPAPKPAFWAGPPSAPPVPDPFCAVPDAPKPL